MTKQKLLIFSDSFTYSGSENVIENIFLSKKINSLYDIHFIYRYNSSYENRFKEKFKLIGLDINKASPVYLLSPEWSINQYNMLNSIGFKKIVLFIPGTM